MALIDFMYTLFVDFGWEYGVPAVFAIVATIVYIFGCLLYTFRVIESNIKLFMSAYICLGVAMVWGAIVFSIIPSESDSSKAAPDPQVISETVNSYELPAVITETATYRLSLIDAYIDEEYIGDEWDEEIESFYVFKFEFVNKHRTSNIRAALVDATVNGYSFNGKTSGQSDGSFSVYTWAGSGSDSRALDVFRLSFSDIESVTNIRNANRMGNADLSFTFRLYIIDEMDDYGEDITFTIENAFRYCS